MRALFVFLFSLSIVLFGAAPARAADFEAGLRNLASSDFLEITAGITQVASSGNPRALEILKALEAGKLYVDGSGELFIRDDAGLSRARTGEAAEAQGALREVPVNNRVRRALGPATSRLELSSPNLATRRAAARELSRRPDADVLDVVRAALETETDDEVRDLLSLGVARVDLGSEDVSRRLAAVKTMRRVVDVSLKSELEGVLARRPDGTPVEPDLRVRREAQAALRAIDTRITLINLVANTFYGLSLGSVLLLASLGLGITFGLMRVINMAHGEMLMLGAYTTFVVQNVFVQIAPEALDWYLAAAVPASFLVCGGVGIALERLVVRHLYGRPLETLLATWGISLMLIQTVRLVFGAQNVTVANPSWLSGGIELMPNLVMPYSRLVIVAFTVAVVLLVWLLLFRTSFGLQIRAVTQNRGMAASMGIRAKRVDFLTFGLGSGVAGLGGVALSQIGNVGPELGQSYIVDSFMVVVLGGVGDLMGAVLGALGLGLVNKYVEPMAGAVLGKILILTLIVLFIQKRPQGLFALKGRAAEV